MRTCDTCPGGSECAGDNLSPVLAEIYTLFASGKKSKFDILLALSHEAEELFERYDNQVSRICWTKASLEIIADKIAAAGNRADGNKQLIREEIGEILRTAVKAFQHFPWYVAGLIGQAPSLYEEIYHLDPEDKIADNLSKRDFVKLCKDVVYSY